MKRAMPPCMSHRTWPPPVGWTGVNRGIVMTMRWVRIAGPEVGHERTLDAS